MNAYTSEKLRTEASEGRRQERDRVSRKSEPQLNSGQE